MCVCISVCVCCEYMRQLGPGEGREHYKNAILLTMIFTESLGKTERARKKELSGSVEVVSGESCLLFISWQTCLVLQRLCQESLFWSCNYCNG